MLRSLSAICVGMMSLSLHASLLDHTVYTTDGIVAECSDFLGKVSSAGAISLRDFLIDDSSQTPGCALNSSAGIKFYHGKVTKDVSRLGCVSTPKFIGDFYSFNLRREMINTTVLTNELTVLGQQLKNRQIKGSRTIPVKLPSPLIEISGASDEILILEVKDVNPTLINTGITIKGDISPDQIIWYFPEANSLQIKFSGMDPAELGVNIGIPGTVVAPKAIVYFQNALITGALYSRGLVGLADRNDCSGLVSGQINSAPLRIKLPGKPGGKSQKI